MVCQFSPTNRSKATAHVKDPVPFLQVKTVEQVMIRETQKHSTEAAEEAE